MPEDDQKRKAKEALEQALQDAISEGEAEEATPEWWAKLRAEITARAKTKGR